MNRRKILLLLAAVIAALGTLLVFLYAQGAEARAKEGVASVQILKAVKTIDPGESFDDAAANGKMQLQEVPQDQVQEGAQTDLSGLNGLVATATIFPEEQIIAARWGGQVETSSLAIPDGKMAVSVNLTDPSRVAGFVDPGSEVSIFLSSDTLNESAFTRILLRRVKVLGVGTTSTITSTTTDEEGGQTTEQLPKTLMTLALSQADAQRVIFASSNGELAFGLLTTKTKVDQAPTITANNLFE